MKEPLEDVRKTSVMLLNPKAEEYEDSDTRPEHVRPSVAVFTLQLLYDYPRNDDQSHAQNLKGLLLALRALLDALAGQEVASSYIRFSIDRLAGVAGAAQFSIHQTGGLSTSRDLNVFK
eukprot:6251678-Pyramimonas_sp.AAC.1